MNSNKIAIIVIFEVTIIIIMFWFPTIYRPNLDSIEYIEPEENGNDDVVDNVIELEEIGNDDVVDDVIEPEENGEPDEITNEEKAIQIAENLSITTLLKTTRYYGVYNSLTPKVIDIESLSYFREKIKYLTDNYSSSYPGLYLNYSVICHYHDQINISYNTSERWDGVLYINNISYGLGLWSKNKPSKTGFTYGYVNTSDFTYNYNYNYSTYTYTNNFNVFNFSINNSYFIEQYLSFSESYQKCSGYGGYVYQKIILDSDFHVRLILIDFSSWVS